MRGVRGRGISLSTRRLLLEFADHDGLWRTGVQVLRRYGVWVQRLLLPDRRMLAISRQCRAHPSNVTDQALKVKRSLQP
jgi:hypothetical protein